LLLLLFLLSSLSSPRSSYSIAVGVVSIVACALILTFVNVTSMKRHSGLVNTVMSIFLALWWAVGAFILTFVNPFNLSAGQTVDIDGNVRACVRVRACGACAFVRACLCVSLSSFVV
jgi:hypothetical protein